MSYHGDDSYPLLARRSTSGFPQQGQIDWINLSEITVKVAFGVLSRLSKAGIEGLTYHAAGLLFQQVKVDERGEQRVLDAVKKLQGYRSHSDTLWFGFGIKHIVRSLSESQEGLACLGVCACLTEAFSTSISGSILRELFNSYNPPADFRPSLHQWMALVKACQGVVTETNFGIIMSGVAKHFLLNGSTNLRLSSDPRNIAKVLKGLFDVSNGAIEKIHISGGADCAWLATIAYWLLGLRVVIEDQSGEIIYRADNLKSTAVQDSQVVIRSGTAGVEASALVQRSFVVPSGRLLISGPDIMEEEGILTHGRPDWATCLCDTFGKPMEKLLKSFATQTGACLGSAARIYEHVRCNPDQPLFPNEDFGGGSIPTSGSYGRGFIIQARRMFTELRNAPGLLHAMEISQERSPKAAVRQFSETIEFIRAQCLCERCNEETFALRDGRRASGPFCMVLLVYVLCNFIRLSSQIVLYKGNCVRPTLAGIERLYFGQSLRISGEDYFSGSRRLLMRWFIGSGNLVDIQMLFTGRGVSDFEMTSLTSISAVAVDGLCLYSNTLCEVSADPERTSLVHVIPGQIQWNGHLYAQVRDSKGQYREDQEGSRWPSIRASTITTFDDLRDSSTHDLETALVIEESSLHTQSIIAKWRVVSSKGFYLLGPHQINDLLVDAYCGKACPPQGCPSLKDFKGILVEGDGFMNSDQIQPDGQSAAYGPFIRVLSGNPAAVWVALVEYEIDSPVGRPIHLSGVIQGRQCIECCVTNAFHLIKEDKPSSPVARVCILTSVGRG